MTVIDEMINKIEDFNQNNNLQHGNAETFEQDEEIITTIEGANHTTLQIIFSREDILEIERTGRFIEVLKRNYKETINQFDVDEVFTKLWSEDFGKHNGFNVKQFINVLEDDAEQFQSIQYT